MRVEVAYATPAAQWLIAVEVPAGSTADAAIRASGILTRCPELNYPNQPIGVFAQLIEPDTILSPNDRVELYRPLQIDPKAQRRARAQAQKLKASADKAGDRRQ